MTHISRLIVHLRSPVSITTEQRQTGILARVESLRHQGLVEDVVVTYWSRLAAATDKRQADEIAAMEAWAARHGCSLAPGFERRDRHSAFTGDRVVVSLPLVAITCWDGEELVDVYPHRSPSGHYTVEDGLNRIESALHGAESYTGSQR